MERKLSSKAQIEAGSLLNQNALFEVQSQADIGSWINDATVTTREIGYNIV